MSSTTMLANTPIRAKSLSPKTEPAQAEQTQADTPAQPVRTVDRVRKPLFGR
jgi:hypothetical protein